MIIKNSSFLSFLFCVLLTNSALFGQSLIINEVSQGPTGSKEYVEFLVIPGTNTYNCDDYCLDLRGWIIDDNNGYFSNGGGGGLGIASGASRFSNNSFWSCIPVGTLILIYNDADKNVAVPQNDNSISDGNCNLVLPISSTLLESQADSPTTSVSTYPSINWVPGGVWGPVGMANGGDSFQTFSPANLLVPVHGVSWLNNSFNKIIYFPNSASNAVYYFANLVDNNPSNQANWSEGTCTGPDDQTPGMPNNTQNAAYIQSLTNNCAGPLSVTLQTKTDAGNCLCNGSATVNVSGSIPTYTYNWFDASNNPIGQTAANASNLCPGNYYCVVRSSINCLDTVLVTINSTTNTITPTFNQISPICVGENFSLPTTSMNNITGSWSPNIDNANTTNYTFTPDAGQCASSTTMNVVVIPKPIPVISPNLFSGINPLTVEFSNQSLNAISYTWNFGNGVIISSSDVSPIIHEFTNVGNNQVWLIASNGVCLDSISTTINVFEVTGATPVIQVPNVFTPNDDNANSAWMINTININEIAITILNRWGNQIAEINDLNGSWNGKTKLGEDATDGTYFYKYVAKASNGKEFTGHGFLTLIR